MIPSALHCEISSSGTGYLSCKPVMLVTLGDCHLLYALVACGRVEAREKIVCLRRGLMRAIVLTPQEPRRAPLVERDAKGDKWSGWVKC